MTSTPPDESPATHSVPEVRELTDPTTMRALTHPVRLALLEALALEGPLSATEAGELIGESPTTCSFHFRQLAKYGFVDEASVGPGRQRHWKTANLRMNFSDVNDDPETSIAAKSLERLVVDRAIARLQAFYASKSNFPRVWQEASGSTEAVVFVTPDELTEFNDQCLALLLRYLERTSDASLRPSDSLPVEILSFRFPLRPAEVAS